MQLPRKNKLEAKCAVCCAANINCSKWNDAVDNAKDLLNQKGLGTDDKVMANLAIARSFQTNNQCETALQYFRTASSLSKAAYGAEARYEIASCLYQQKSVERRRESGFRGY